MKLLILGLLACFAAAAWAGDENDMYFESSGDGVTTTNPDLPFDDEDTDEASGDDDEKTEVQEIDIDEEPEVTEATEKTKVDVDMEVKNTRIVNEPAEKPVKEVEGDVNAAVDEGADRDSMASAEDGGSKFLAAVIVGGCIGLLFAICVIMLLVYRMRKKDEGSYALEYGLDSKKPQGNYEYTKGVDSKEYFA